jgi:hypothetical protein
MYSAADYVEILIIYGKCEGNAKETARGYAQRFPNRNHPDHKTILSVIARTVETDQIPMTVRTVENEYAILDAFEEGTESIKDVAQELNILETSAVYLVMKTERQRPYHYTRVQHLQPEDYPPRREFCTWLLNLEENNPNFVLQILFSDESIFGRRGCYNAHNWHICVEENPHDLFSRAFQERFYINLCWSIRESCGMSLIEIILHVI